MTFKNDTCMHDNNQNDTQQYKINWIQKMVIHKNDTLYNDITETLENHIYPNGIMLYDIPWKDTVTIVKMIAEPYSQNATQQHDIH